PRGLHRREAGRASDRAMSDRPYVYSGKMSDVSVIDNHEKHRFELHADGNVAFLNYNLWPSVMELVHTEVPKALEGRGIGGKLATAALESARVRGLKVKATCPFVTSYIQRHAEFSDLIG